MTMKQIERETSREDVRDRINTLVQGMTLMSKKDPTIVIETIDIGDPEQIRATTKVMVTMPDTIEKARILGRTRWIEDLRGEVEEIEKSRRR